MQSNLYIIYIIKSTNTARFLRLSYFFLCSIISYSFICLTWLGIYRNFSINPIDAFQKSAVPRKFRVKRGQKSIVLQVMCKNINNISLHLPLYYVAPSFLGKVITK